MPDQLFELNSLIKNSADVWVNPSLNDEFSYSDGSDEEQYLINVLQSVSDLSVDSVELAASIQDWVSEYHLSSLRSNLLKNINFVENSKILELGCGCGAITRFLAEQGHQVTAVEGSLNRAEIARTRNRDLANVEVITHNFNTLKLPQRNYHAVLFVGVLEYAKRFSDQKEITSEQTVIKLLNKASEALNDKGCIIIAIENRTGLKYQHGALEDHLATPDVGINDYKDYEFTGIKTYDYSQWRELLSQCNLMHKFYYPFPDYKLPNLIINREFDCPDKNYLSTQINSYDPISDWIMPKPESQLWQQIFDQKKLNEMSNSFGIIATKSETTLVNIFTDSWCLFDSPNITPGLRIDIRNKLENNYNNNNEIKRFFNKTDKNFLSLRDYWLEKLVSSPCFATLRKLVQESHDLINNHWQANKLVDFDQMMVDQDSNKLTYGKYWQLKTNVTAEQQLFHVLLDFCLHSKKLLAKASDLNFLSIDQIIADSLEYAGFNYQTLKGDLIEFQQKFNDATQIRSNWVAEQLSTLISNRNQFGFSYVNYQLFFTIQANQFKADKSKTIRQKQTGQTTKLIFENLDMNSSFLRFDPCDHQHGDQHYFSINSIQATDQNGNVFYEFSLIDNILLNNLEVIDGKKAIYKVNGIDPQIIFALPDDLKNTTASYNLVVQLQWLGV